MKQLLFLLLLVSNYAVSQTEIVLYDGIPPGNIDNKKRETRVMTDTGREALNNVTIPSITYFRAPNASPAAPAVIICPGGGYHRLSIFDGGYEVAKQFNNIGVHAIVLKYRTRTDSAYRVPYEQLPFQDLRQAFERIQSQSKEWGIDLNKVGIIGLSAGGHLASMASTPSFKLPLAFQILIYPIISFQDHLVLPKMQSRKTLLGSNPSLEQKQRYSPELQVDKNVPPTCLIQASDDPQANLQSTLTYYQALLDKKIPAQLIVYQAGGHGFALYNKVQNEFWMPSIERWLKVNRIL